MFPNVDNLESDHFIARKNGPYYEIVEKETGDIKQTLVSIPLPRKRFNQPIRNKIEALNGVLCQEVLLLRGR